jgi:hypothetical protein
MRPVSLQPTGAWLTPFTLTTTLGFLRSLLSGSGRKSHFVCRFSKNRSNIRPVHLLALELPIKYRCISCSRVRSSKSSGLTNSGNSLRLRINTTWKA